ncbi:uncharacterized protein KGF55_001931 [Candida pseudojiufengensis]|uniref:uncharacterized protein n=1 Tax=Candida pseudojiufengensis TaxID=497109 RepID=UPI0022247D35|nr:uncharacterized protein KGF55_001931 [Candida pseudojiufengensis]KAI5964860.1 hypothetical protein KGF55_001931 [Candida pseudojiufengensis]
MLRSTTGRLTLYNTVTPASNNILRTTHHTKLITPYFHPIRQISFNPLNIVKAIHKANEIDERFKKLDENTSTQDKIKQIIDAVKDSPELLFQLNFFFYECNKININHDDIESRKRSLKWWYIFVFKLVPLNNAFWDTCYTLNKAQHKHKLNFKNLNNIGLLDPKNFPENFINELGTGKYNGIDFRNVIIFSFSRPKFKEISLPKKYQHKIIEDTANSKV